MNTPSASLPANRPPVWFFVAGAALAVLPAGPASLQSQTPPVPVTAPGGTADSNGRMIAVTGTDVTGASILYLVDTVSQQLAVYQATGGGGSTQGVRFVGARRISLDMQLDGFNDHSDYSYKDLRKQFESKGLLDAGAADPTADD